MQTKKLEEDLSFYEIEMKKSRFVFENYEREVTRWRKEVEDQENKPPKMDFLKIPGHNKGRKSSSRSRSRSRSKSK